MIEHVGGGEGDLLCSGASVPVTSRDSCRFIPLHRKSLVILLVEGSWRNKKNNVTDDTKKVVVVVEGLIKSSLQFSLSLSFFILPRIGAIGLHRPTFMVS